MSLNFFFLKDRFFKNISDLRALIGPGRASAGRFKTDKNIGLWKKNPMNIKKKSSFSGKYVIFFLVHLNTEPS